MPLSVWERRSGARWLRGQQLDGDRGGLGANDRSHDGGPVPVVFDVVGTVDVAIHIRGGVRKRDVTFETADPDATVPAALARRNHGLVEP